MASALISKRAGPAELTDEYVRRPDVQALMKCVVVTPDDREDTAGYALYDQVKIDTQEGNSLDSGQLLKVRGGPDLPLDNNELWMKFENCLQAGAANVPPRKLFDSLMSLDRLSHVRELPGLTYP